MTAEFRSWLCSGDLECSIIPSDWVWFQPAMKIRLDEYEFLGRELCQLWCREFSRTGIPVWPDLFRMFVLDDSASDVVSHS